MIARGRADILQRRPGIVRCYHTLYRCRPAPVRYVTTQKKFLKNRLVPGRLSNSLVICKSSVLFVTVAIHAELCTCISLRLLFRYSLKYSSSHLVSDISQSLGHTGASTRTASEPLS